MEEVGCAIKKLKNNKAAGSDEISAEMIKAGGELARNKLHLLIAKIWKEDKIPEDWRKVNLRSCTRKGV